MMRRFLPAFIFTLVVSVLTYADTLALQRGEQSEASQPGDETLTPEEIDVNIPAQPLLSSSARRLTLIEQAYLDTHVVLRERNSCSRFFGGPRIATIVLNSLFPRLKTALLNQHVGISMSGTFTMTTDSETGLRYRLFQKTFVNLAGPFYRSADEQHQAFFKKIGYFSANTREARVTMLLHEMGHLLANADGIWLLPDDGGNPLQVGANTAMIMNVCGEQIKSLRPKR